MDNNDDCEISSDDLKRYMNSYSDKVDEIISYGELNEDGNLTFAQFILAFRGYFENEITEWLKLVVSDDNHEFELDEYKNILS